MLNFFFLVGTVQDCIVFSITPPDSHKGPIGDMRCVIPIRLVTDPAWLPALPGHVPPSELVPQASPTTSEAHGTPSNISGVEEDASYKFSSEITLETVG